MHLSVLSELLVLVMSLKNVNLDKLGCGLWQRRMVCDALTTVSQCAPALWCTRPMIQSQNGWKAIRLHSQAELQIARDVVQSYGGSGVARSLYYRRTLHAPCTIAGPARFESWKQPATNVLQNPIKFHIIYPTNITLFHCSDWLPFFVRVLAVALLITCAVSDHFMCCNWPFHVL